MKAWIARNENGDAYLHTEEPMVSEVLGIWYTGHNDRGSYLEDNQLPDGVNPQWSDNEPIEVELTIQ